MASQSVIRNKDGMCLIVIWFIWLMRCKVFVPPFYFFFQHAQFDLSPSLLHFLVEPETEVVLSEKKAFIHLLLAFFIFSRFTISSSSFPFSLISKQILPFRERKREHAGISQKGVRQNEIETEGLGEILSTLPLFVCEN